MIGSRLRTIGFASACAGFAATLVIAPQWAFSNARDLGSGRNASEASTPLVARLLGSNEVPNPGDPAGSGSAAVTVDRVATEVCWDYRVAGIGPVTASHIHEAAVGVAGPIVVNFNAQPTGCTQVTQALADRIFTNATGFYVNVHTAAFPGGAVRGQLAKAPGPAGAAIMLPVPLRAYDSRNPGNGILAGNSTRTVSIAEGVDGTGATQLAVPPGASAALVTLTATETQGSGWLRIYSAAAPAAPPTSNINWTGTGQSVADFLIVAVDANGRVTVGSGPSGAHFVVDVVGYTF